MTLAEFRQIRSASQEKTGNETAGFVLKKVDWVRLRTPILREVMPQVNISM
jgi:hypothetical protein